MELKSLKETENFSKKFSQILKYGDVVFLYGEIGTGKTTFTRFLINNLEAKKKIHKSDILSPTFNIIYDYDIGNMKIQHYDLYRLKNNKDIQELGMFDVSNKYIKLVEWPELINPKPKNRIDLFFKYSKLINSRKVKIKGFGEWKDYKFNAI